MTATELIVDVDESLPSPQSMSVGELKRELIERGDSSFVFNDQEELLRALIAARRMGRINDINGGVTSSGTSSEGDDISQRGGAKNRSNRVATAVIPTIEEEPDTKQIFMKTGSTSRKPHFGRRISVGKEEPRDIKFKNNVSHSGIETTDESVRLVEYFVVVSSKPITDASDLERRRSTSPLDPLTDELDSRTLMRFDYRRAHLPGGQGQKAFDVHLTSIGLHSSTSTASTCSSDDYDLNRNASTQEEIRPTSLTFSGHSGPPDTPKKNVLKEHYLEPVITARYPAEDRPDHPLNPKLPQFCHPEESELIHPSTEYKMPRIHYFVLTDANAGKLYATCLTVYEEFIPDTAESATESSHEAGKETTTYYAPRVLCLLSTWPYLSAFRTYLTQLYRLATATDLMEAPIERYVLNLCEEIPAPPRGSFEVQLSILNNPIRFWAPPAKQPIAYVGLPFKELFECLDIGNVLFVWYTLACEHKVLLVSDQLSLLAVCAEILCSLLFPMQWSHLYIPVLPRSLTPMLDAPMPYLCGISRENFQYAVGDIGDDTIVVDLDRNLITRGSDPIDLPPLPHKHRTRLEAELEHNVGHVFWNARGLTKEEAVRVFRSSNDGRMNSKLAEAHALWNEKIRSVDEAFNMAHAPDSTSMLYNEDARADSCLLDKQSKWDAVQESFLRFYVSALKDYRKFLPAEVISGQGVSSSWREGNSKSCIRFKAEEFVMTQRLYYQPFLEELIATQQFDDFITKRIYAPNEPDVLFFDKSIDAKKNRSILKMKKVDTSFLHSANAHRDLQQYRAMPPNRDGIPNSASSGVSAKGIPIYHYPTWPKTFDVSMFCDPRPIPKNIASEFERRHELRKHLSTIAKEIQRAKKIEGFQTRKK